MTAGEIPGFYIIGGEEQVGRKNRRRKAEYRNRLGFDPWKYINGSYASGSGRVKRPDRIPRRGDIWFAALSPHAGTSVQGGCRPVLVISNNFGNTYAETLNVLPMTRQLKRPELPCHTELHPEMVSDRNQVIDTSMILAEQITTIGRDQLRNYVGCVTDSQLLHAINHAVSVQLGLAAMNPNKSEHDERSAAV